MKTDIFDNTNWAELQEQKVELLSAIAHYEEMVNCSDDEVVAVNNKTYEALQSILHFFDAFMDHAVDVLGLPESLVFPGIEGDKL